MSTQKGMAMDDVIAMLVQNPGDELAFEMKRLDGISDELHIRWCKVVSGGVLVDATRVSVRKIEKLPEMMIVTLREMLAELIASGHIDPEETVDSISAMYRDHYRYAPCGCQLVEIQTDDEETARFRRVCPEHEDPIDPVGLEDMRKSMVKAGLA